MTYGWFTYLYFVLARWDIIQLLITLLHTLRVLLSTRKFGDPTLLPDKVINLLIKTKLFSFTFFSSASFSVFKTQSSDPVHLVIILLRAGLQNRIHLLGVTPLVLF